MSTIAQFNKPAARMTVKVPHPDSLVEVRVSPPESNFEIKVAPGGDVIELLIRPGASSIEVRITPVKCENGTLAEQDESVRAWTRADPVPPDENFSGPENLESPAQDLSAEDEGEVVTGVSKAEFKAMVAEEAAAEAKKLLAELDDIGPTDLLPVSGICGYVLPEEAKKSLEAVDDLDYLDDLEDPSGGINQSEFITSDDAYLHQDASTAGADSIGQSEIETEKGDQDEPEPALEPGDAFTDQAVEELAADNSNDDGEPSPAVEERDPELADSEAPNGGEGPEHGPAGPESDSSAINTGTRDALARLSAAVQDEDATVHQLSESVPPDWNEPAVATPAMDAANTVMVETINDADPAPNMAAETITPLSDDDQMDLSPIEGDEELDIEPISITHMEFDLEKSRPVQGSGGPKVLRAKPMAKVNPGETIVPIRN